VHELLHACCYFVGMREEKMAELEFITRLSPIVHTVMKENDCSEKACTDCGESTESARMAAGGRAEIKTFAALTAWEINTRNSVGLTVTPSLQRYCRFMPASWGVAYPIEEPFSILCRGRTWN
jgi:hypothetical protein